MKGLRNEWVEYRERCEKMNEGAQLQIFRDLQIRVERAYGVAEQLGVFLERKSNH